MGGFPRQRRFGTDAAAVRCVHEPLPNCTRRASAASAVWRGLRDVLALGTALALMCYVAYANRNRLQLHLPSDSFITTRPSMAPFLMRSKMSLMFSSLSSV